MIFIILGFIVGMVIGWKNFLDDEQCVLSVLRRDFPAFIVWVLPTAIGFTAIGFGIAMFIGILFPSANMLWAIAIK